MRWRTLGGLFALLTLLLAMLSSLAYSSEALASHEGSSGGGSQQQRPVDRLIQQQVGEFQLKAIDSFRAGGNDNLGASDHRDMSYESPNGVKISHKLADFTSPHDANKAAKNTVKNRNSSAFRLIETFTVVDNSGRPVGSGAAFVDVRDGENDMFVVWTNGTLLATMNAPAEEVGDFFKELPYGVSITDRVQY